MFYLPCIGPSEVYTIIGSLFELFIESESPSLDCGIPMNPGSWYSGRDTGWLGGSKYYIKDQFTDEA